MRKYQAGGGADRLRQILRQPDRNKGPIRKNEQVIA